VAYKRVTENILQWRDRRGRLADSVKKLLTIEVVIEGFFDNFSSKDAAFSALRSYSEGVSYITQRASAVFYCGANLTIGNSFANTDVHNLIKPICVVEKRLIGMRIIVNKI
jgi:hypothetical protein